MLDAVCKYLPSPMDKDDIKGTIQELKKKLQENQTLKNHSQL